jgi:signal transduction histidine kinase
VVLIVSLVIVFLGTKTQARPMREIKAALEKFSKGDFSARVRVKGNDEVAQLCASFNEMADALEQVESSRRSFMANISHDLKTPITSIVGFIDGILDGTIPQERSGQYLQRVSKEMKRLSRLVYSILDVTRLEGGQVKIVPTELNIQEMILQVMLSFERSIEEKKIEVAIPTDEGVSVRADEDSIYRVLTNLIGNAVKFTPEGGKLCVSVEKPQRQQVMVRIRNIGVGIAQEELPFLFERFYKSDKSRGMDKEGTGLGLYIAKMLVNLNNGEIGVKSEVGQYTEFYFTLDAYRDLSVTGKIESMIKKQ